jgi:hypothetical protein
MGFKIKTSYLNIFRAPKNYLQLLLMVLMVSGFISCQSNRNLIKGPIKDEGEGYLFGKLQENQFKFNTFSAKFNIEYLVKRKPFEFKGQVNIVKDSAIWVIFTQDLGIEMARMLITLDSVKFLDRINKKYFVGDYDFVNNFLKTNVDFGVLQSIILGNDFEYYDSAVFKASIDNKQYKLTTTGRQKLKKHVRNLSDAERVFFQSIWLDPQSFKINQIKLKELTRNSKKLTASYAEFENVEGQLFPFKIVYEVEADVPVKVKVDYSKIQLNGPVNFPFKIPEKYSPVN